MKVIFYYSVDWVKEKLEFKSNSHEFLSLSGSISQVKEVLSHHDPEIVFLIGFEESKGMLGEIGLIIDRYQKVSLILVLPKPTPDFLIEAMRNGITEVSQKFNQSSILEILHRIEKKNSSNKWKNSTYVFLSSKGGDGSTCVASNFAVELTNQTNEKVLLIDLSLPFGDLDLYLSNSISKEYDLIDFVDSIDRLDESLLDSMVNNINENLHLIASSEVFEKAIHIQPDKLIQLIQKLKTIYNHIVIDCSSSLNPIVSYIFEKVDHIYIINTINLLSIRQTSRVLTLIESVGFPAKDVSIIVNQKSNKNYLKISDAEEAIKKTVEHILPFDSDMQEFLLNSKAIVNSNTKSEFSKKMNYWVSSILFLNKAKPKQKNKKISIWSRLKKK